MSWPSYSPFIFFKNCDNLTTNTYDLFCWQDVQNLLLLLLLLCYCSWSIGWVFCLFTRKIVGRWILAVFFWQTFGLYCHDHTRTNTWLLLLTFVRLLHNGDLMLACINSSPCLVLVARPSLTLYLSKSQLWVHSSLCSLLSVAVKVPWKPYGMFTGTTALPSSSNVLASKTRRNALLSWKVSKCVFDKV